MATEKVGDMSDIIQELEAIQKEFECDIDEEDYRFKKEVET